MKDTLFLFEKPFCVDKTARTELDYIHTYLSEDEREDEKHIQAILFKFALTEKLFEINEFSVLTNTQVTDTGSWVWTVNWMNFRSLVDMTQYSKLMQGLQTNNSYPVNQIIDLHMRLGSLFNSKLLNTLCNRMMQSVTLIPYEIPADHPSISWRQIHIETPFIWLLIFLQIIIRSEVKR